MPLSDRRLAKHLVSLYLHDPSEHLQPPPFTMQEVADYISHVKRHITPKITDEVRRCARVACLVRGGNAVTRRGGRRWITWWMAT